jgi:hypothetical protein
MDALIQLVGHLAWPATVFTIIVVFNAPLTKLISVLGSRITKIDAFSVKLELSQLSKTIQPTANIEALGSAAIDESSIVSIADDMVKLGSADFFIIDIGQANNRWLTSRLFLLCILLEKMRAVRCIVFLQGKMFIGAATPRDIRATLGARYFEYEAALVNAYASLGINMPADYFRGGFNGEAARNLSTKFLESIYLKTWPPVQNSNAWVNLTHYSEFAHWLTPNLLKELLDSRLFKGAVVASVGPGEPKTIEAIVLSTGPFIALTKDDGEFLQLCDRTAILEAVGRQTFISSSGGDI